MTLGPPRALLWICACQVHVISAARPSRDLLGVLTTLEDERENHSHFDQSNHGRLGSGYPAADPCQFQKDATRAILQELGLTFKETGHKKDHCRQRGITCRGCQVVGIHLRGKEVSGYLSETWASLKELQLVDLSKTNVKGDIAWLRVEELPKLVTVRLSETQVVGDVVNFKSVLPGRWDLLRILDLSHTNTFGDIEAFKSSRNLRILRLAKTRVDGDIESLQADPDLPGCRLKDIDLTATRVSGNIRAVQAFPDLRVLKLKNTLVFGDISAFEATRKLQSLELDSTGAFGDITIFRKNKELKELQISLSQVFGDIRVFQETPRIENVRLDATQVEGDIGLFKHLPHLCGVQLSSTKVTGDIAAFNSTRGLEELGLSDTEVSGDLAALGNITALTSLILRKTQVWGNMSALQGATGMIYLDLSATFIQGDIRVLEDMIGLGSLALSSTNVSGDLAVFHRNNELMTLDLSFTNVSGDIRVFNHTLLMQLRLASSGVWGNLHELIQEGADQMLETIDLSNTKVEGNIFVMKHAKFLKELYLQGTEVAGSIDGIVRWKQASVVDLSHTFVRGRLTEKWRGCCKHLRTLKLSGSRAQFLPIDSDLIQLTDQEEEEDQEVLLPALTTLEVSGCPLNGQLRDLVLPLASCEHLGSIIAVNSGLKGFLPKLDPLGPTRFNGDLQIGWRSKLASSLEILELSGNNLSFFESIPPSVRKLVVSSNKIPLRVAEGALRLALRQGVSIDLRGTTLHNGTREEAKRLLQENVFGRTSERTFTSHSKEGGYTCYNLDRNSTTLQVFPNEFLPEELCACLAGWEGTGAGCNQCPLNTFKPDQGPAACTQCPANTKTNGTGSTKKDDCGCRKTLRKHAKGEDLEEMICDCPKGGAIFDGHCLECFPPKKRCRGGTLAANHCGEGYQGPLCMQCRDEYYAVRGSCKECQDTILPSRLVVAVVIVSIVALLGGLFFAIASLVCSLSPFRWVEDRVTGALTSIFGEDDVGKWRQQLAKRQAPLLLQMCQLWSVLSALAIRDAEDSKSFWELKYVKHVQLVVGNVQEILYLQCYFGGKEVRKTLAFAMPVVPLLLLLCCACLEFRKNGEGSGVNAALKILTLFFVGGASKCAALVTCQRVDAGGYNLHGNLTVLRHLPDLPCKTDTIVSEDVALVFWPCAVCYAILIPCFLFYIYVRQHLVLRYTRTPLELDVGSKTEALAVSHEDSTLQRRLLAGLVAYVAVLQRGSVRVRIKNGNATVAFLDNPDGSVVELDAKDDIKKLFETESKKLQHYTITEMLLERFTLEQEGQNERCLKGAKETLLKYSTCRDSWMEVVLKLVTVAIVQAIASSTGSSNPTIPLAKVSAATMSVAATVWMMRPYAEPQVNELQVVCFLGLATAAVGFCQHMVTLSRAALLIPLMLAAVQQTRPDSAEILAQRLWEKLPKNGRPPEEPANTFMLPPSKAEPISFRLEYDDGKD